MAKWNKDYIVYSYHCNNMAKIRISAIAQLLQESARMHAESSNAGFQALKKEGLLWVLSSLLIKINSRPKLGDKVSLDTWGKNYDKLFAYRDFEMFNADSGEMFVQASSAWLLINSENHRPRRITSDYQRVIPEGTGVFDEKPGNIQLPDNLLEQRILKVLFSDIDIYNHVNNTRYIQWCIDSFNLFHLENCEIEELDIRFIAETHLNDEVGISLRKIDANVFFQGKNLKTDKELFKARIKVKNS